MRALAYSLPQKIRQQQVKNNISQAAKNPQSNPQKQIAKKIISGRCRTRTYDLTQAKSYETSYRRTGPAQCFVQKLLVFGTLEDALYH